jgi:hypothetical protein
MATGEMASGAAPVAVEPPAQPEMKPISDGETCPTTIKPVY